MEHQATEPLSNKAFRSKPRNSLSAHGEPMIWITGGALCLCLFMIIGLLGLVVWQGLTSFWPRPIVQITTLSGDHHLGIQSREESYRVEDSGLEPRGEPRMRRMIRTGNYELTNTHFTWVDDDQIETIAWPEWAVEVERQEWGRFYGVLAASLHRRDRPESPRERDLRNVRELLADFAQSHPGELPAGWGEVQTGLDEAMRTLSGAESKRFANDLTVPAGARVEFVLESGERVPPEEYTGEGIILGAEVRRPGAAAAMAQFELDFPKVRAGVESVQQLQKDRIGAINARMEAARLDLRELELELSHEADLDEEVARLVDVQRSLYELGQLRTRWDGMVLAADRSLGAVPGGAELFRASAEMRLALIGDEMVRLGTELDQGKRAIMERFGTKTGERALAVLEWQHQAQRENGEIMREIAELRRVNEGFLLVLTTADGVEKELAMSDLVRIIPSNRLSFWGKLGVYRDRWAEFLTADPREANSEGGVYPAIIGTVVMTLMMAFAVVPFGVMAALYLREYARAGAVVSAIRIAINNLAGVPSIVFGVFGLGFFCYVVGGYLDGGPVIELPRFEWFLLLSAIAVLGGLGFGLLLIANRRRRRLGDDRWLRLLRRLALVLWLGSAVGLVVLVATTPFFDGFYRAALPNPTFGKGALIWASLTLSLLTLPVVIVATEEALSAVPNSMREGSYACGASKWQTIQRIVLPRAMPGIMTGTILAMARGAGEVAPLMLVGAVKLAPELPISTRPPFGLNGSFMHLGFHIYDLGFQSQNSEAAKPIVFTTTLLLIALIALLNLLAIWLRNRLRRRFKGSIF
ncbi:MAG: ABC transporter permease subunit [Verrucomicrobiota bacterium]|nr:ABC transporter permease subunit [Verrucomicrobiota bacterium]